MALYLLSIPLPLALSGGCGSTYAQLRPERQHPVLGPLVSAADAMPRRLVHAATTRPGEPPVRLAIHQTGNPAATGPVVVLVHGVFSDADAWRYVAGDLGRDHTLWLVELPGCGASDHPAPADLGPDGYAPGALADRVLQALAAAAAPLPPDRPLVLAGHSLAATVLIRATADPDLRARHAAVRRRVAGLVLVTPVDVAVGVELPVMEEIAALPDWKVALADATGLLRERMAEATFDAYHDAALATREEADRGLRIFRDPRRRHATQAMIRQAVPRRGPSRRGPPRHRPDWPAIDRLVAQYGNIDVPVTITFGEHDEAMPAAMSYKLARQIPGAKLEPLPHCMHSPHLECPVELAGIIRRSIGAAPAPPDRFSAP